MSKFVLLLILGLSLSSCNSRLKSFSSQDNSEIVAVDEIPTTFSPPLDEINNQTNDTPTETPTQSEETQQQPGFIEKIKTKASSVIEAADFVMRSEGKKLGAACNVYLGRVLSVLGFPQKYFLAGTFQDYAKKYFTNYHVEKFTNNKQGTDRDRLKKYIWSYPERTPFIFQWSPSALSVHGHIAFVERVDQKLIIYQASLNRYTARKDQTSINDLLSGWAQRQLTVYSDFE